MVFPARSRVQRAEQTTPATDVLPESHSPQMLPPFQQVPERAWGMPSEPLGHCWEQPQHTQILIPVSVCETARSAGGRGAAEAYGATSLPEAPQLPQGWQRPADAIAVTPKGHVGPSPTGPPQSLTQSSPAGHSEVSCPPPAPAQLGALWPCTLTSHGAHVRLGGCRSSQQLRVSPFGKGDGRQSVVGPSKQEGAHPSLP